MPLKMHRLLSILALTSLAISSPLQSRNPAKRNVISYPDISCSATSWPSAELPEYIQPQLPDADLQEFIWQCVYCIWCLSRSDHCFPQTSTAASEGEGQSQEAGVNILTCSRAKHSVCSSYRSFRTRTILTILFDQSPTSNIRSASRTLPLGQAEGLLHES